MARQKLNMPESEMQEKEMQKLNMPESEMPELQMPEAGMPGSEISEPEEEKTEEALTLEQRFEMIESILNQLEDGNTSLEQAFELYKKGLNEVQAANSMMDKMEKEMLVLKSDGSLETF